MPTAQPGSGPICHHRKVHPTAQRLADVALRRFEDRGYDNTTTAEIAAAAGVTQRTFFRHFASKHDVLFADNDESTRDFVELLYGQPPELRLTDALIETIAKHAQRWPPTNDDVTRVRIARETASLNDIIATLHVEFERTLVRWIAQRSGRSEFDFDVRVVAATLVAARRVVVDEWIESADRADVVELARRAIGAVDASAIDPERNSG